MDQQLKKRLVGVAVIFSLAVIFLPMLLDGSGRKPEHLQINIPPAPVITSDVKVEEKVIELKMEADKIPRIKPFIVDETADRVQQQQENGGAQNAEAEPESGPKLVAESESPPETEVKPQATAKPPVAKKQVGGSSWVIQVGSYTDKNKAYAQRDSLRKSALSAVFIEKFEHDGKLNYRVRMGPFITRDSASVVNNKLLAKYDIKGLVMRYEK